MIETRRVVVMGVAGSGKTTVGQALADAIGAVFLDADSRPPAGQRRQDGRRVIR